MIDPEVWKENIFMILDLISDENFQRSNWFEGPGHLHPAELVNMVDDFVFEDWISEHKAQLHFTTVNAAYKFYQKLCALPCDDLHEAFCSPQWIEIRLRAKALITMLTRELGAPERECCNVGLWVLFQTHAQTFHRRDPRTAQSH